MRSIINIMCVFILIRILITAWVTKGLECHALFIHHQSITFMLRVASR